MLEAVTESLVEEEVEGWVTTDRAEKAKDEATWAAKRARRILRQVIVLFVVFVCFLGSLCWTGVVMIVRAKERFPSLHGTNPFAILFFWGR